MADLPSSDNQKPAAPATPIPPAITPLPDRTPVSQAQPLPVAKPLPNREQPATNREQPATNREQPAANREQSAANREQPASAGERPPEPSSAAHRSPSGQASAETDATEHAAADDADDAPRASLVQGHSFLLFNAIPSWLTSMIFHVIVLLLFALLKAPDRDQRRPVNELVLGRTDPQVAELEEFSEDILEEPVDLQTLDPTKNMINSTSELIVDDSVLTTATDVDAAALRLEMSEWGLQTMNSVNPIVDLGTVAGTAISGRGQASRARLLREGGGTPGSEAAVAMALDWFARHQNQDGSWYLNHQLGACKGRCRNPGTKVPCANGATGLALLPFLGAGHTHLEGEYKDVVKAGLAYLLRNMRIQGDQASLVDEGNYYSHGLCAIALCEAYAMTKDEDLRVPAQMLINHTVAAQDPIGGGWRYDFQQPGDTSAHGWQVMALKSAHMAYLHVPRVTVDKASRFLDSVESHYGARYGYITRQDRRSTTAVGLLCRMYLGWPRDHAPLQEGVAYLAEEGPLQQDIYANYYATQVMRHYGGEEWTRWNEVMRDYLIETQAKDGHEKGSWFFTGRHNEVGGRLYATSLATMILEVYYRHLPLYKDEAVDDDFPL